MSKMQRNLDGIYFRVERDGKWENVYYSDMEQRERDLLADALYDMGEQLGVACE